MLMVDAKKGRSEIHGLGLFAHQFIPAGSPIWQLHPVFDVTYTEAELLTLPLVAREQVRYYSYYDPKTQTFVMPGDDDRFTNHSDTPNMIEGEDGSSTIARRDIQPGEEITWDYRQWGGINFTIGAHRESTKADAR